MAQNRRSLVGAYEMPLDLDRALNRLSGGQYPPIGWLRYVDDAAGRLEVGLYVSADLYSLV